MGGDYGGYDRCSFLYTSAFIFRVLWVSYLLSLVLDGCLASGIELMDRFPRRATLLCRHPNLLSVSDFGVFVRTDFVIVWRGGWGRREGGHPPKGSPRGIFFRLVFLVSSVCKLRGCCEDPPVREGDKTGADSAAIVDLVEVLVSKPSMSLGKSPAMSPAATTL